MEVINPEGSQLNQPSCPGAKKNPLSPAWERAPQPRASREPDKARAQLGRRGAIWRVRARPARRRSSRVAADCVLLPPNTPRLGSKCVACSQLGPASGWGTSGVTGEGLALSPGRGRSRPRTSPGLCPCSPPPCLAWSPRPPVQALRLFKCHLPLLGKGRPPRRAWPSLSTYGLAQGAAFSFWLLNTLECTNPGRFSMEIWTLSFF